MSINFNSLPTEVPSGQFPVIPEGKYKAMIEKAEMKQPKDSSKPPYLNIMWKVFNPDGSEAGKLFDMLTESDSRYMQYKIRKFMEALEINLGDSFELSDLCKVCQKGEAKVAVKVNKDSNNNDQSQVDIFDANMYAKLVGEEAFMQVSEGDAPFAEATSDSEY